MFRRWFWTSDYAQVGAAFVLYVIPMVGAWSLGRRHPKEHARG